MKLTLKVETTDTAYEVVTNLFVIVMWERKYKRKASDMASGIGVEDLAFMAYEASKVNKIVVPSEFETFIKNLDNIEVIDTEAPNPT
jgi:O-phosphoseryl-tRNA(Cys) synthetase